MCVMCAWSGLCQWCGYPLDERGFCGDPLALGDGHSSVYQGVTEAERIALAESVEG